DLINNQHGWRLIAFGGFFRVRECFKKLTPLKEFFHPNRCPCCSKIGSVLHQLFNGPLLRELSPTAQHLAGSQTFNARNVNEREITCLCERFTERRLSRPSWSSKQDGVILT